MSKAWRRFLCRVLGHRGMFGNGDWSWVYERDGVVLLEKKECSRCHRKWRFKWV